MDETHEIEKEKTQIDTAEPCDDGATSTETSRHWLELLKILLDDIQVVPTVHAAKNDNKPPEKPKPIPPNDLPIYESPHATYNQYAKKREYECAKKSEYLQETLRPTVKSTRIAIQKAYRTQRDAAKSQIDNATKAVDEKIGATVKTLRDDENLSLRQGMVALGGMAGYLFSFKNGVILKIINSTIGATAMGALCFPTKTDQLVRKSVLLGKSTIDDAYFSLYGERLFREDRTCPPGEDEDVKK